MAQTRKDVTSHKTLKKILEDFRESLKCHIMYRVKRPIIGTPSVIGTLLLRLRY
jgi:hypothetical protein